MCVGVGREWGLCGLATLRSFVRILSSGNSVWPLHGCCQVGRYCMFTLKLLWGKRKVDDLRILIPVLPLSHPPILVSFLSGYMELSCMCLYQFENKSYYRHCLHVFMLTLYVYLQSGPQDQKSVTFSHSVISLNQ